MKSDDELLAIRARVLALYEELKPVDVGRFFRNVYAEEPNRLTEQELGRLMELVELGRADEAVRSSGGCAAEKKAAKKGRAKSPVSA